MAKTEKIDVLHVTEACGGGVRRHLELLLPVLQASGSRVGLFAFSARAEDDFASVALEEWRQAACQVRFLPLSPTRHLLCQLRPVLTGLQSAIQLWRPRVLHWHSGWAALLGCHFRRYWPDLPMVYTPHALHFYPGSNCFRYTTGLFLERYLARYCAAVVLVGEAELQAARAAALPEKKLLLAPNALPEDFLESCLPRELSRFQLALSPEEKAILIPCRLAKQKGLDLLLQAIAAIKPKPEKTVFHFCGEGPELANLKKLARQQQIVGLLRFHGRVPELQKLLLAFDAAILPSLYEGSSYAVLECLAAGLPILLSDIPANRNLGRDWPGVAYFRSGSAASLAAAWSQGEWRRQKINRPVLGDQLKRQCQQLMSVYERISPRS